MFSTSSTTIVDVVGASPALDDSEENAGMFGILGGALEFLPRANNGESLRLHATCCWLNAELNVH